MKIIDTKISVVWPSWCYTDKANCNVIKECHKIEKNFDVNIYRDTSDDPRKKIQSQIDCGNTPLTLPALVQLLLPATTIVAEKTMLSESSILLSGYSNNNTINSTTRNRETSNTPLSAISLSVQGTGLTITPTTTTAAAAAYLYLEKVKNERMSPRVTTAQLDSLKDAIMESSGAVALAAAMVNNNNSISSNNKNNINNNNNYNSSSGTANNYKNNVNSTNNSLVNSQFQNQICSNSTSNTSNSNELHNHSITPSCNQSLQQQRPLLKQSHHHNQQQQHQQESLHMNSNHVKKERLSPGTNGDHQTCISRSRSTTPSSFSGTPPDSSPPDASGSMYNLSTNLLKSIHHTAASSRQSNISVSSSSVTSASLGIPTDFSTRNYSDFMRSLAAKYNNTNPNDNLKRNILLEATLSNKNAQNKSLAAAQKAAFIISPSTPLNKDVTVTTTSSLPAPTLLPTLPIPPSESLVKVSQQNKFVTAVANAAVACSSNASPYMTSFLSSLPFSPGIFPHLIDMSSTQALITLARAAKEHEIHNILSFPSQHQKRSATSTPPSPSPSLNVALQQAAQFISPALIYSVQLQKKQLQQQQQQYHQQQSQDSRQSSPCLVKISNSATSSTSSKTYRNLGEKVNVSPLDLSSQPPATKRFKAESTSSQSSTDGLMHTTITRSASSSTATMSPSPPPITEKSLSASAIVVPATFVTASLVVDSSSKTEETATAITPIKIASSAAVTSSITPAVTVRQCQAQSEELNSWTVDDVCAFVRSIDICAEYVKSFRDQCIDGSGLPLLTEDHLVNSLGMKLGPALKLRSVLAKKLGGPCPCVSCVAQIQQVLALQASGITATAATAEQTTTGATATNISAVGSYTKISGSCNSHLANRTLAASNGTVKCSSYNSVINSSFANKNESIIATTSTIATNTSTASVVSFDATTTNVCNSHGNTSSRTRSNRSSLNINVDNFSSPTPPLLPPPPATSAIITLQQQHYLKQKQPEHQQSALQNICNSKGDNNPTTNRHDKDDSIS